MIVHQAREIDRSLEQRSINQDKKIDSNLIIFMVSSYFCGFFFVRMEIQRQWLAMKNANRKNGNLIQIRECDRGPSDHFSIPINGITIISNWNKKTIQQICKAFCLSELDKQLFNQNNNNKQIWTGHVTSLLTIKA